MIEVEDVGVPKGEGQEQIDTDRTIIDSEALDTVIELLEDSMKHKETYTDHDEIRFTGHIMATNARKAYEALIEAHPDYELKENE